MADNKDVIRIALIGACIRASATALGSGTMIQSVGRPVGVPDASDVDEYARSLYELATARPWESGAKLEAILTAEVIDLTVPTP